MSLLDSHIISNRARAERAAEVASEAIGINPLYISNTVGQLPPDYEEDTGPPFGQYFPQEGISQRLEWNSTLGQWEVSGPLIPDKSYVDDKGEVGVDSKLPSKLRRATTSQIENDTETIENGELYYDTDNDRAVLGGLKRYLVGIRDTGKKINTVADLEGDTPSWYETLFSATPKRSIIGYNSIFSDSYVEVAWNPDGDKQNHNGGSVFSPSHSAATTYGDPADNNWHSADGADTGTGVWEVVDKYKLTALNFGAISETNTADAIAANNNALQAYADFCGSLGVFQKYDTYFHYDETLDFTSIAIAKLKGVENRVHRGSGDEFALRYHGASYAMRGINIELNHIGIRGNLLSTTEGATNTAIRVSNNLTWIDSNLRSFDSAIEFEGGYYHDIRGGRIDKCRTVYDFATHGISPNNFRTTADHVEFVDCLVSNGSDGPCSMGGSYERFTGSIVTNTSGTPDFLVHLNSVYVENGGTTVEPGLTGNDADIYESSRYFNFSEHRVTGEAFLNINGCTNEVFRFNSVSDLANVTLSLNDVGSNSGPQRIVWATQIKTFEFNIGYRTDLSTTPFFEGGINDQYSSGALSIGSYTDTDGIHKRIEGRVPDGRMQNGWINSASAADIIRFYINEGTITIIGTLDGSSATADEIANLPSHVHPSMVQEFVITDSTGPITCTIDTSGIITTASRDSDIHLNITYRFI